MTAQRDRKIRSFGAATGIAAFLTATFADKIDSAIVWLPLTGIGAAAAGAGIWLAGRPTAANVRAETPESDLPLMQFGSADSSATSSTHPVIVGGTQAQPTSADTLTLTLSSRRNEYIPLHDALAALERARSVVTAVAPGRDVRFNGFRESSGVELGATVIG